MTRLVKSDYTGGWYRRGSVPMTVSSDDKLAPAVVKMPRGNLPLVSTISQRVYHVRDCDVQLQFMVFPRAKRVYQVGYIKLFINL